MKTGDRESGDRGTPSDAGENVIRLPREWIGPLEELVPIRPASPVGAPGDGHIEDDLPPTADAFWSEDAGALHNAVRAPEGPPVAERDSPRSGELGGLRARQIRAGGAVSSLRSRWGRVRLRQLGVAAVAVPLVAMALIGTLWASGSGRPPAPAQRSRTAGGASSTATLAQISGLTHKILRDNATAARTTRDASGHHAVRHGTRVHTRARARRPVHPHAQPHSPAASTPSTASSSADLVSAQSQPAARTFITPSTTSTPYTSAAGNTGSQASSTPSTTPTGSSAGSGHSTSSGSTPAFGSSGALGPGSSPNS